MNQRNAAPAEKEALQETVKASVADPDESQIIGRRIGAAVFFLSTRHLLGTIVAGMGLYTMLRLVL